MMRIVAGLLWLWLAAVSPATAAATDVDPDADAGSTAADAPADDCPPCSKRHWPSAIQAEQDRLAELATPDGSHAAQLLAKRLREDARYGSLRTEPRLQWQWRLQREKKPETQRRWPVWLQPLSERLHELARLSGTLGHVLLWLLLLVLLVVLWRRARHWRWRRRADAISTRIAGIDIAPLLAPDALPEDVVAGSEHLWGAGYPREALSLLYRAALYRLGRQLDFAIPDSATEHECLHLIERRADRATTVAFRELLAAWLALAWENRTPEAGALPRLVDAYRRVSRETGHAPAGVPA